MIQSEEKDKNKLLTREEFRKKVLARFNGKCCCVGCTEDAVDAHHIMDRKLWSDSGYYLSNGAALCAKHHMDAESGKITPAELIKINDISADEIVQPDTIDLTREDYLELLLSEELNKWGELTEKKDYDEDWFCQFHKKV